jgi:hypothetical protein
LTAFPVAAADCDTGVIFRLGTIYFLLAGNGTHGDSARLDGRVAVAAAIPAITRSPALTTIDGKSN